jgi:hypothetical protein
MQSASQFLSEFLNTRATGWLVDFITLASYCAWAMGTENHDACGIARVE